MAIGLALLFNIGLPVNFNSPYKATNIQDFWRRWHITLSRFLRDYVYIPLGGNKKGSFRTYNNLMATFVIGGLWHGAGWTFIFWGFLHGLALIIQRLWEKLGFKLWTWLAWFITFNFVNIAWVFFRAKEWGDAVKVLRSMFSLDNTTIKEITSNKLNLLSEYSIQFEEIMKITHNSPNAINWIILSFVLVLVFKNSIQKIDDFKLNYKNALFTSVIFTMSILSLSGESEFLYFRF